MSFCVRLALACFILSTSACSVLFSESAASRDADFQGTDAGSNSLDSGRLISCEPFLGVSDAFDDQEINSEIWFAQADPLASVSLSDGQLRLKFSPDARSNASITTTDTALSMIDKRVSIEVATVPSFERAPDSNVRLEIGFNREGEDHHYYVMRTFNNDGEGGEATGLKLESIHAHRPVGEELQFTSKKVDYDPVRHRYWQIRESDSVVHFEAAETMGQWEELVAHPLGEGERAALGRTALQIRANSRVEQDEPGVALIDNVNVDPNCAD